MININGTVVDSATKISTTNRALLFGDALFETIKVVNNQILFFEDHYFRLMASMRILRMEIPMTFTQEFFEDQILNLLDQNKLDAARVKIFMYRGEDGLYLPQNDTVSYIISLKPLQSTSYMLNEAPYVVDLYKDNYVSPSILSTLKTNNKALHVIGAIYAKENDLDNCLVLNTNKHVVEALQGNLFLVKGNVIKTPPLTDGCLKGVMRKQILQFIEKLESYTLEETSISPFELQQADELFLSNVIVGIQPITKYRKKTFQNTVSKLLFKALETATQSN